MVRARYRPGKRFRPARVGGTLPVVPADVRTLDPADLEPGLGLLCDAFGQARHPEDVPVELGVVDATRFYGAYDGAALVGTAGSFALSMPVPGGRVGLAGVTWVGVAPTARRQGVLNEFMTRQLDDLHAEGTAVAALWASEGAIYQRYGYGPAAWHLSLTLPRGAALRRPVALGGLRQVAPDRALLAPVYDAVADHTPGWFARDDAWWAFRLHDPEHARGGATALQCVVTDGGYALYSLTSAWRDGVPRGTVTVRELAAVDEPARERLWRHLLDLDLMSEVVCRLAAVDDPLLSALAEPRQAAARMSEGLYVRLVDVCAALSARTYACDVDLVLQVRDERCPWNARTLRLTGGRLGATCLASDAPADLVLDVGDLGAAYLGGTSLQSRRATVQERTPGALARASTAFGPVDTAPWCPMVF